MLHQSPVCCIIVQYATSVFGRLHQHSVCYIIVRYATLSFAMPHYCAVYYMIVRYDTSIFGMCCCPTMPPPTAVKSPFSPHRRGWPALRFPYLMHRCIPRPTALRSPITHILRAVAAAAVAPAHDIHPESPPSVGNKFTQNEIVLKNKSH